MKTISISYTLTNKEYETLSKWGYDFIRNAQLNAKEVAKEIQRCEKKYKT